MAQEILINKEIRARYLSVGVREGPGMTTRLIGYLEDGVTYKATLKTQGYIFVPDVGGWVLESATITIRNLSTSTKPSSSEDQQSSYELDEATKNQIQTQFSEEQKKDIYMQYVNNEYGDVMDADDAADTLLVSDLNGIWGIPYQFPESVDPPLDENENSKITFGYFYADRIINRMPLLIISPGKVAFMQDYKKGEAASVLDALVGGTENQATVDDFLSKPGKYYTFEYDEATYWEYVDTMNQACAIYLGIGDVQVTLNGHSGKLKNFNWKNCSNNKFDDLLMSSKQYVCFYTDADTTKQETFSNSTQKSQLADSVNSMSDVAKEIQFLIGANTGSTIDWLDQDNITVINEKISEITKTYLGGSQVVQDLAKEFATIATGGKLIFPEIWSDSEFTQSLDVKIKLRCPCPNKVSWFLDILAPLNMLIALTMPRTPVGTNLLNAQEKNPTANSYYTPFLVRAFYKGLFNCDMGIITDLSITKGKEGSWTIDGLPSEVDVDLTIKDLYNVMAMTNRAQKTDFLNNTTFLNYLANACGISINKPDVERSVDLWIAITTDTWKEKLTGYTFWQHATQGARNKLYSIYAGIFRG